LRTPIALRRRMIFTILFIITIIIIIIISFSQIETRFLARLCTRMGFRWGSCHGRSQSYRFTLLQWLCTSRQLRSAFIFRSSENCNAGERHESSCLSPSTSSFHPWGLIGAEPIRQGPLLPGVDATPVTCPSARRDLSSGTANDNDALQRKSYAARASALPWAATNQPIHQTPSTQKRPLELSTVLCHICTQSDCRLSSQSRARHQKSLGFQRGNRSTAPSTTAT